MARTARKTSTTAKSKATEPVDPFQAFLSDLADLITKHQGMGVAPKDADPDEADPEDEDDDAVDDADDVADADDDADGGSFDEDELQAMKLPALKKLAIAEGFNAAEVKDATKDDIIEALLADDEDDDGDADDPEDEDADDADEDADEEEREELMALTAAALRKKARDEFGATANEVKGLDKESLVDLILNADEDDDTPDDDDDADDDPDAEGEEYTQEDVDAMSLAEVKEQLDEWGIDYKPRTPVKALRKLLLDSQFEE